MSRSLGKLLVLAMLVATLTALGVSLAFAEIDSGNGQTGDPVATVPPLVYLSIATNGRIGDLRFRDEDIILFTPSNDDGTEGTWEMFFDGSDVGVGNTDVTALEFFDGSNLLMSFDRPIIIPGIGRVDDSDIVKFTFDSTGEDTDGTFELCFDGSDYDLTTGAEDIDAIAFDADGRLLISTLGTARVNGTALRANDEDLIALDITPFDCNPGPGDWEIFVDGSDLALTQGSEDINGAWVDVSVPENNIYLAPKGRFNAADGVNSISGDAHDVFGFSPFTLGENNTTGFLFASFGGNAVGQRRATDGLAMLPQNVASDALRVASVANNDDDENIVQFAVEADDLANDDFADEQLDEYDSLVDPLDEEEVTIKLFVPIVHY